MLTLVSLPDFDPIRESTLILLPINLEHEPAILDSHIPLMEKECEFYFFDLDSTIEPIPTLELTVNFFELVMVPEPITLELKSAIPPSHILLLDISIDHDDFVMIFQDWLYEGDNFHDRILYNPIYIGGCKYVNRKEVNKCEFHELPHYRAWVPTLNPIRPPPEPPPKVIFSLSLIHI